MLTVMKSNNDENEPVGIGYSGEGITFINEVHEEPG